MEDSSNQVFKDHAEVLWELGYSVIPIKPGTKHPVVSYDLYRDKLVDEATLQKWIEQFPDYGIGLVVGPASGLAVIDLDIKNNDELLNKALAVFPRSPLERFGSKGLGIFIRYNNQTHRKIRFKGVDIGEVITNTLIVIPPTIHPQTNKPYFWTSFYSLDSDLKSDLLQELPAPTDQELAECEARLNGDNVAVDMPRLKENLGRNDKLKSLCGAYIKRGLLPEQIAPRLVAEDAMMHGDRALFQDRSEFKKLAEQPLAAAYLFCSSIFRTYLKTSGLTQGEFIPQFDKKTAKEASKEETEFLLYEIFLKEKLKHAKRCKIDLILKQKNQEGIWKSVGNMIDVLKSYATDAGLAPHKMKHHFERYQSECKPEMLWDVVPWSGNDSIAIMFNDVECDNLSKDEMIELFKHWIVKALTRLETQEQNSMILLHGEQGVGKDTFLKYLLSGFRPYFQNFTDTYQEKDMFMQISKNIIINISEFDKLNRQHPGMVKDLISRETAQFRPSHMQHVDDFLMRASFIGSTNAADFLTDRTGNRRFWIFKNFKINSFRYSKHLGPDILAQAMVLKRDGFEASKATIMKVQETASQLGPRDFDSILIEMWNEGIAEIRSNFTGQISLPAIKHLVTDIQKALGLRKTDKIYTRLWELGAKHKSSGKIYYRAIGVDTQG